MVRMVLIVGVRPFLRFRKCLTLRMIVAWGLVLLNAPPAVFAQEFGVVEDLYVGRHTTTPFGGIGRYQNLLTYSEVFDNAAWVKAGVTVTANSSTVAPDGTASADLLADDAGAGTTVAQVSATAAASKTFRASVWLRTTTGTATVTLSVDSNGGTATSADPNTSASLTTEWERFSVKKAFGAGTGNARSIIDVGTNTNVLAWGAQLEDVTNEPETDAGVYVKTVASAVSTTSRGVVSNTDLLVAGAQTVNGNQTITGNLDVAGTIEVGTNNQVLDSPAAGVMSVGGDLRVVGNDIQDSGGTARLTLGATNTVTGNLTMSGNLTINKDVPTLTLSSVTANEAGRPRIKFGNNVLGVFYGDDTADQVYGFYTAFSNARTNDAILRIHGSAAASWNTYLELKHDGTNGFISTDTGNITLDSASGTVTLGAADNLTVPGDLAVNGGDITSSAATLNINAGGTVAIQDAALNLDDGASTTYTINVGSVANGDTTLSIQNPGAGNSDLIATIGGLTIEEISTSGAVDVRGLVPSFSATGDSLGGGSVTLQGEANVVLRMDKDNDETNRKVAIEVNAGTEVASFNESGQLSLVTSGTTGGLVIGSDSNLYRSAANVLKTDDRFDVAVGNAVSAASYGINVANTDTNAATDGINKYGLYATSTGTFTGGAGAATNNYGLYVDTVSGADNNYAASFASGNVGIGTTEPTSLLHLVGSQPAAVTVGSGTAATTVLTVTGSTGGDTSATDATAGAGASISLTAGTGGMATGGGLDTNGAGGNITITAGATPDNVGGIGFGASGSVTLTGGAGGRFFGGGIAGGAVNLTGGAGGLGANGGFGSGTTPGAGGALTLAGGTGGNADSGAPATTAGGIGGAINLTAGAGGTSNASATNASGGNIVINGGAAGTGGSGGSRGNIIFADLGGKVGIGDTSPASLLTVGSGEKFQVDASGNVTLATGAQLAAANLGIEFSESDTNPGCAAGNFTIFADLSENKLKKCQNGTLADLDTTGAGAAYSTIQEEGTGLTQRATLNFIGAAVTAVDDAANSRTNITITEADGSTTNELNTFTADDAQTTSGLAVTLAGGTNGIDTVRSAADTIRFDLDPTEVGAVTWLDNADRTWTFDIAGAGTNPTLGFSAGMITLSAATVTGALAANGGITFDQATDTVGAHTMTGQLTFSGVATDITTATNEDLTLNAAGTGHILLAVDANSGVKIPDGQTLFIYDGANTLMTLADAGTSGNLDVSGTIQLGSQNQTLNTPAAGVISTSGDLRVVGNDIQDSGGTARITMATSSPHVLLTGDAQVSALLGVGSAASAWYGIIATRSFAGVDCAANLGGGALGCNGILARSTVTDLQNFATDFSSAFLGRVDVDDGNAGTGVTLTTAYGMRLLNPVLGAGGDALTNNYGLYINDMTSGGTKNVELGFAGTTPVIEMANTGTLTINDGTNDLMTVIDRGTRGTVTAGRFVYENLYWGEEFIRNRANATADTLLAYGDNQAWGVDENTVCTFSMVDDQVGGVHRLSAGATNRCLTYISDDATANNPHLIFNASKAPTIVMSVMPSVVGANNDFWVGLGDVGAATASTPPNNGIFFTNNDGTTWTGVTRNASTSTTVACTGQTISTTTFAYLRIEVRATNDVRFFVDPDASDGINEVECGSGSSTNIHTGNLTGMFMMGTSSGSMNLDVDYFRLWQTD